MHMNRKPKMTPYTLKDFQSQFPDDATCLDWLRTYLYPDGIYCKNCEQVTKHHRVKSRPSYSCDHCGNHVHPTAGTIFHKSCTPLTTWFYAIYLMASTRCGISAKQIQRETGVTYKTAWRMFKQIRTMLSSDGDTPLGGKRGPGVEIDEMYVGGKTKNEHRRSPALRRQQRLRSSELSSARAAFAPTPRWTPSGIPSWASSKSTSCPRAWSLPTNSPSMTISGFIGTNTRIGASSTAETVYVVGDIHTNTIEGFWSLVKRGIGGVYHNVGKHYLQSYLDEFSFRYNHRFDIQPMFATFMQQIQKRDAVVRQTPVDVEPF